MTDSEVRAALDDYHALALTMYGEARGEAVEGQLFVGCVIRNRVKSPRRFGDTYTKVCTARAQFSCWWPFGGRENYALVMARARAIVDADHAERLPPDPILRQCLYLASGILSGELTDRAQGATHYLTRALWTSTPPAWAAGRSPLVQVGRHVGFAVA